MTEELTVCLAGNPCIQVKRPDPGTNPSYIADNDSNSLILFNLLCLSANEVIITSRLQSLGSDVIVWAHSYQHLDISTSLSKTVREIATKIANDSLDPVCGQATWSLNDHANGVQDTPFQPQYAMYLYYQFLKNLCEHTFEESLNYLEKTRSLFPRNMIVRCLHMDLIRAGYAQGISFDSDPIADIQQQIINIHKEHPECPVCRNTYFFILFHTRRLSDLRKLLSRALSDSNLPVSFHGEAALLLMLSGDWDAGSKVLHEITISIHSHPEFFRYPLALNAIRKERYQAAKKILGHEPSNCSIWYWLLLLVVQLHLGDNTAVRKTGAKMLATRSHGFDAAEHTVNYFILDDKLRLKFLDAVQQARKTL